MKKTKVEIFAEDLVRELKKNGQKAAENLYLQIIEENKLPFWAQTAIQELKEKLYKFHIEQMIQKQITLLEKENKLLKQVVYAAAMFLDYFPKQIHPELNAEDFLKEPPLGSTGLFEPQVDARNVYTLARTAKETLDYINNGETNV